ncbi:RNA-binding protein [Paenibacillus hamazuiensis]|uniref:YlmH family RNA-binding protein n=1 Tax=Paenibacillus hamazuiensis TaxID=2936508 RepID=UPI00200F60D2
MAFDNIYSHFHPDEHRFVDKAAEWVERAVYQHTVKKTDFLDPRQAFILQTLVNRETDVQFRLDGGYEQAERKRAIVAPGYRHVDDEDMGIAVVSVRSDDEKIKALNHGDYLGSVLGLGIKRDKIGDIHVHPNGAHLLVASEIAEYIHLNLQQVHRVHVLTETLPLAQLQVAAEQLESMSLSVASLRLDGIAGDVYRLSRAKIVIPIKAGRCKVNWKQEEDPSTPLKQGDVVSLQGFGRFKVLEVEGMTKKGRIRVHVGKYV